MGNRYNSFASIEKERHQHMNDLFLNMMKDIEKDPFHTSLMVGDYPGWVSLLGTMVDLKTYMTGRYLNPLQNWIMICSARIRRKKDGATYYPFIPGPAVPSKTEVVAWDFAWGKIGELMPECCNSSRWDPKSQSWTFSLNRYVEGNMERRMMTDRIISIFSEVATIVSMSVLDRNLSRLKGRYGVVPVGDVSVSRDGWVFLQGDEYEGIICPTWLRLAGNSWQFYDPFAGSRERILSALITQEEFSIMDKQEVGVPVEDSIFPRIGATSIYPTNDSIIYENICRDIFYESSILPNLDIFNDSDLLWGKTVVSTRTGKICNNRLYYIGEAEKNFINFKPKSNYPY